MKDIHKHPLFYYILVPAVMVIWPLLVSMVYLPSAEQNLIIKKEQYTEATAIIKEILKLDPGRLDYSAKTGKSEFNYADAVDEVAKRCNISTGSYRISSGMLIRSGKQRTQSAKLVLNDISILKFAEFLSEIQMRWDSLQCTKVKLAKKEGLPDTWKVDIDFKYYY